MICESDQGVTGSGLRWEATAFFLALDFSRRAPILE